MSATTFHFPSCCFFQTHTYLPFVVVACPFLSTVLRTNRPVSYAKSPEFETSTLDVFHWNVPGEDRYFRHSLRSAAAPRMTGDPVANLSHLRRRRTICIFPAGLYRPQQRSTPRVAARMARPSSSARVSHSQSEDIAEPHTTAIMNRCIGCRPRMDPHCRHMAQGVASGTRAVLKPSATYTITNASNPSGSPLQPA